MASLVGEGIDFILTRPPFAGDQRLTILPLAALAPPPVRPWKEKMKMRSELLDGPKTERQLIPMTTAMAHWLRQEAENERRGISQIVRFAIAEYAERIEHDRQEISD